MPLTRRWPCPLNETDAIWRGLLYRHSHTQAMRQNKAAKKERVHAESVPVVISMYLVDRNPSNNNYRHRSRTHHEHFFFLNMQVALRGATYSPHDHRQDYERPLRTTSQHDLHTTTSWAPGRPTRLGHQTECCPHIHICKPRLHHHKQQRLCARCAGQESIGRNSRVL